MRAWQTGLGVILAGLLGWTATAEAGYRGPFEGRVIDAETRQPIQGAVVVVEWLRGTPTPAGRVDSFYDAAEVLTDENGYFRIEKKWSWNPWTNWMLQSSVIIFKAGYGSTDVPQWPLSRLKEIAEDMKTVTEEERKGVGPTFYFDIEFEDRLPVFLLRKLTTVEERRRNLRVEPIFAGPEKMKLLIIEHNQEARAIGREDAVLPVPGAEEE